MTCPHTRSGRIVGGTMSDVPVERTAGAPAPAGAPAHRRLPAVRAAAAAALALTLAACGPTGSVPDEEAASPAAPAPTAPTAPTDDSAPSDDPSSAEGIGPGPADGAFVARAIGEDAARRSLLAMVPATQLAGTPLAPLAAHAGAPRQGSTWHLQLDGVPPSTGVDVYDIDGTDTPAADVARLKADGAVLVCYLNAGAAEDWRDDADRFRADVVGTPMDGWAGERWVDVRRLDALLPIMGARMDTCARKGFDAVDPDNVDAYIQDTGFDISVEESARYVVELARLAHDRGLAFGLKNSVELLPYVEEDIDFAVNEECAAWDECGAYDPVIASGRAVLHIEYTPTCTTPPGFSSIRGEYNLDGPTHPCA